MLMCGLWRHAHSELWSHSLFCKLGKTFVSGTQKLRSESWLYSRIAIRLKLQSPASACCVYSYISTVHYSGRRGTKWADEKMSATHIAWYSDVNWMLCEMVPGQHPVLETLEGCVAIFLQLFQTIHLLLAVALHDGYIMLSLLDVESPPPSPLHGVSPYCICYSGAVFCNIDIHTSVFVTIHLENRLVQLPGRSGKRDSRGLRKESRLTSERISGNSVSLMWHHGNCSVTINAITIIIIIIITITTTTTRHCNAPCIWLSHSKAQQARQPTVVAAGTKHLLVLLNVLKMAQCAANDFRAVSGGVSVTATGRQWKYVVQGAQHALISWQTKTCLDLQVTGPLWKVSYPSGRTAGALSDPSARVLYTPVYMHSSLAPVSVFGRGKGRMSICQHVAVPGI